MCLDQFIRVKRRLIYIFWYDRETLINELVFFFKSSACLLKNQVDIGKTSRYTEAVLVELYDL